MLIIIQNNDYLIDFYDLDFEVYYHSEYFFKYKQERQKYFRYYMSF